MSAAATTVAIAGRLVAGAFFLMTSVYALLVYVPFSYQQFILPNVSPALSAFVAWHPFLFLAVVAAIAASSAGDLRSPATRAPTLVFLAAMLIAGCGMTVWPPLQFLRSDRLSLLACVAFCLPVLLMAALDMAPRRGAITWRVLDDTDDRRTFFAALYAALFVSLTYLAIAAASSSAWRLQPIVVAWSVTAHLVLFGAVFLAVVAVRGVVSMAGGTTRHETALLIATATLAGAVVLAKIAFAALSFTGPIATATACAFAATISAMLAGVSLRLHRGSGRPVRSGMDALTAPLAPLAASRCPLWGRALAVVLLAAGACVLSWQTFRSDWNQLLQQLAAFGFWFAAFATFYAIRDGTRGAALAWLLLAALLPAAGYRAFAAPRDRAHVVLDRHAGSDASFRLIHDAVSSPRDAGDREFYALLRRHTNIPREEHITPVDIQLVDGLAPRRTPAPHIFIFVIDSLRPDYLSPYNPRVTFTPAIEAFARTSVVFKRAITRYGATGLSEPSIWAGAMLPHKQYVMPFAPMNSLQKLLATGDYQRFISRDTILRTILPPADDDIDLDAGIQNMAYTLCGSLDDLRRKVVGRGPSERPIFAYTQPQDVHISVLTRAGPAPGSAASGFHSAYAARVQKMDACFGQFIEFLRAEGLYDNSVVVLTSDHGDSLGEGGRWGHAYTIFPEILRIPLIVHLPAAARAPLTCDTDAVVSLLDITPSLYYVLEHRPLLRRAIFGRPLCTLTAPERIATRQDWYLVASSYGAVYGIVRGNGRWLFIADGINYTDYLYDLDADAATAQKRVTPEVRREYRRLIREGIEEINRFYPR